MYFDGILWHVLICGDVAGTGACSGQEVGTSMGTSCLRNVTDVDVADG